MKTYDLSHLNVIVAEPSDFMRRLFIEVIRGLGVRNIRQADCLEDAIKMFDHAPPDILFTDWSPKLDALSLLDYVRRDPMSMDPYCAVIVVSAHSEVAKVCEARDKGATEFLTKPMSAKLIYLRICSVIERHRSFIRIGDFFGPDRRRRNARIEGPDRRGRYHGPERRFAKIKWGGQERRRDMPGYRHGERKFRD